MDPDELIEQIQNLTIQQQQLVTDLVQELQRSNNPNENTATALYKSDTTVSRVDCDGNRIVVGDKVEILTTRRTGHRGDTATVVKFTREYTTVQLDRNGSETNRMSKHLKAVAEYPQEDNV